MIDLKASKKECFFEDLHINDKVGHSTCSIVGPNMRTSTSKMTVTYQVDAGGHLDIDFLVRKSKFA